MQFPKFFAPFCAILLTTSLSLSMDGYLGSSTPYDWHELCDDWQQSPEYSLFPGLELSFDGPQDSLQWLDRPSEVQKKPEQYYLPNLESPFNSVETSPLFLPTEETKVNLEPVFGLTALTTTLKGKIQIMKIILGKLENIPSPINASEWELIVKQLKHQWGLWSDKKTSAIYMFFRRMDEQSIFSPEDKIKIARLREAAQRIYRREEAPPRRKRTKKVDKIVHFSDSEACENPGRISHEKQLKKSKFN